MRSLVIFAALGLLGLAAAPDAAAAALPPVHVTPERVTPGETFFVSGSGCLSSGGSFASFSVSAERGGRGFGAGGSVNPNGTWRIDLTVPADFPTGVLPIRSQCDVGRREQNYPPASITVEPAQRPTLTVSPDVVHLGGRLVVRAAGFGSGEQVAVTIHGGVELATATTDDQGRMSAAVHVPLNTRPGTQRITATGASTGRTAHAKIVVVIPSSPSPTPPPLANTGIPVQEQALLAGLLLAIGALCTVLGRRSLAARPLIARGRAALPADRVIGCGSDARSE